MSVENLMRVIGRHKADLDDILKSTKKDIDYNTDLIMLNEKHNKFSSKVSEETKELKIRQSMLEEIISDFNEIIEDEEVDMETIMEVM